MITLCYKDAVVTKICDWESTIQGKVMQDAWKFYCTKEKYGVDFMNSNNDIYWLRLHVIFFGMGNDTYFAKAYIVQRVQPISMMRYFTCYTINCPKFLPVQKFICVMTIMPALVLSLIITRILNTLRPRQDGRHFADDTFKRIFLNENVRIAIKISLKFVAKGPINNIPALV